MTTISLKLPETLLREIEDAAAVRGVTKSAIIRESLKAALPKRRPKRKVSCLDLMVDAVGSVHGPSDLSTNRKHLKDAILKDHERQQGKHPR